MSDAADYFLAHARSAVRKARRMERGAWRNRQRRVARVYHLLAKQAARGANVARMVDLRQANRRRPVSVS
jgi:phosphoribosylformimino-5-aminoimidazole carboxamide ribonucleotide (ProFAR) isomerase